MNHHYVVNLERKFKNRLQIHPPYWKDMIQDKSNVIEKFFPEFDALFRSYNLKFWLTKEYDKKNEGTWTDEELFIGLAHVFITFYIKTIGQ